MLKTASHHLLQYYVALPSGWSDKRQWPIVVAVGGNTCDWTYFCDLFVKARGPSPFVIVVPVTVTNEDYLEPTRFPYPRDVLVGLGQALSTPRLHFDEEGVLAALEDVKKDYRGEDRFFIAGHSGGGHLTWRMAVGYPQRVAAAALGCGNFFDPRPPSAAPERATVPIRQFQGDKDANLLFLNNQWNRALEFCKKYGYSNVSRVMVPGRTHDPCAGEIMNFFREQVAAKEGRRSL